MADLPTFSIEACSAYFSGRLTISGITDCPWHTWAESMVVRFFRTVHREVSHLGSRNIIVEDITDDASGTARQLTRITAACRNGGGANPVVAIGGIGVWFRFHDDIVSLT